MQVQSLNHLFLDACDRYQKPDAFKTKRGDRYVDVSHEEVMTAVEQVALALHELGVAKGDRVALLSENRLEWAIADYGILGALGVTVPIYTTLLPHQIEYLLKNSESKVAFVSTREQLERILPLRDNLKNLKHVVVFEHSAPGGDGVMDLDALMRLGQRLAETHPGAYRARATKARADDLATIIYTSGTTGIPKGVMLSHGNLVANVLQSVQVIPIAPHHVCLSFLPLSHILERLAGHYLMLHKGCSIAYAESVDTVQQNMLEVRPTVMISVPRLYDKIYARVKDSVAASRPLRQRIFHWALGVGWRAAQHRMVGRRVPGFLALQLKLADRLVFRKLRERTGGRIEFFVSGGAPLSPEVAKFFLSAGFTILEGYGLTETSPVLAVNRPAAVKIGTVGPAIPGVELRIAEDGEILARGDNIMQGYFKDTEDTREVIDADGWFHTGDVGFLDDDGYLTITDRKKDLLVTSGGKNIAPQPIENLLKTSRYIAEAVMVGDQRKFPAVLIVPAFENLASVAEAHGLADKTPSELCEHPKIFEFMQKEIDFLCKDLAQYERPKKIRLIPEEFTIASGELTPSLKVKRRVVGEKFKDLIESLYRE